MKDTWSFVVGAVLLSLIGCAGKGERIDVAVPGKFSGSTALAKSPAGPRVAVLPFEDQRPNQGHLGTRSHLWGGVSYFDLPSGTISTSAAQALVEYLTRQGWQATLARTQGSDNADVTIVGAIQDLSIDATSGFMHTDLSAKNTLTFQITNHSDGSVVRKRVSGTGTDQVFWFEPEDAQALTTELLEKNLQRFMGDIQIDGQAIRLK